jgi:hypothetical protein
MFNYSRSPTQNLIYKCWHYNLVFNNQFTLIRADFKSGKINSATTTFCSQESTEELSGEQGSERRDNLAHE